MTASARVVRRLMGGDIPQQAVDNLPETVAALEASIAVASTDGLRPTNAQAADYSLVIADLGKAVQVDSATAKAVTVPPNASVAFPVGAVIEVVRAGAGAVSLAAGDGVTITGDTEVPAVGASLLLRKTGTNAWWSSIVGVRSGTFVQTPSGSPVTAGTIVTADDSDYVQYAPAPTGVAATDTAAIQAAVDAVPVLGGRVVLRSGVYRLNAPIVLKTSLSFVGQSRYGTKLLNMTNTTALYADVASGGTRRIHIADIIIDDNLASGDRTAGHGIHIDGGVDAAIVDIERVHIQQHFDGIRLDSPLVSTLTSVRVNNARNDGFSLYGLGTGVSYRGTYAVQCVRHGYYADGNQAYCAYLNTSSDSNGGAGYHAAAGPTKSAGFSWTSCGAEDNNVGFHCIDAVSLTFNSVSGSVSTTDGMKLEGCKSVVINAPRLQSNDGYGLNVLTSSTPIVSSDFTVNGRANIITNVLGAINDPVGVTRSTQMQARWTGGKYYGPQGIHSTAAQGLSVMSLAPLWVPTASTISRIGAEVTTTGAAGSVVRLGIYADDGFGFPSTLLLDAGTIDGTSATAQEIILGSNLSLAGGLYWVAAAAQVATCTLRTIGVSATVPLGVASLAALFGSGSNQVGYYKTGITGAFPDPLGAVTATTGNPYKVGVKAS